MVLSGGGRVGVGCARRMAADGIDAQPVRAFVERDLDGDLVDLADVLRGQHLARVACGVDAPGRQKQEGVGDAGGAVVGLVIVNEARRLGVPNRKMARMLVNIGLDAAVGSVPLLGDVFDVFFKSHQRNVQIILDHFEADQMASKEL